MTFSSKVAFRETEEGKGADSELNLVLDVAGQVDVVSGVLIEVLRGLLELELGNPLAEKLLGCHSVKGLDLVLVIHKLLSLLEDLLLLGDKDFLQADSLGNDVALHGLLLQLLQLGDSLLLGFSLSLLENLLPSESDGVHVLRLK